MTSRWLIGAAGAGALSLALHGTGLIAFAPLEPQALAGGPTQLAMIGNSFEDAVAGTISSESDLDPAEMPEVTAAPENLDTPDPAQRPEAAAMAAASPSTSTAAPSAQPAQPTRPVLPSSATFLPVAPGQPSALAPSAPTAPTAVAAPTTTVTVSPTARASSAPVETVVARDAPVVQTPTADTPRPQQRTTRPVQTQAPPRAAPTPPAPQGSATETTRAGQASGTPQGSATRSQQGNAGQAAASDGAAAARYPEQVLRRLNRIRRPNTSFSGAAVIAFSIASGGGLSRVSVARSSGDAQFDQLAIAYVQRAAPFPPPPAGAQRSFSVTVRGR